MGVSHTKAIKIIEYGNNNDEYLDRAKLHQQVINKALLIIKTLYPRYLLLFLFDNIIT